MSEPSFFQSWPHIIWREWCNCDDADYAQELYDLVIDQPVDGLGTLVWAGLGGLYGLLGGGLVSLLLYELLLPGSIGLGLILGLVGGGVAGGALVLSGRSSGWFTWRAWLRALLPQFLMTGSPYHSLYLRSAALLSSGVGVGVTGIVFYEFRDTTLFPLLFGCLLMVGFGSFRQSWAIHPILWLMASVVAGLFFGLFFGLGFAQLVGLSLGPLDVSNSARLISLAVGIGVGLFFGGRAGLLGVLLGQLLVSLLAWLGGLSLIMAGWLLGILLGGVAGSLSQMSRQTIVNFDQAYPYRPLFLWWARRPPATVVEAVLREHAQSNPWREAFRGLDAERYQKKATDAGVWLGYFNHSQWVDRFIGRQSLVKLGGDAIPQLVRIAASNTNPHQKTARWLVRSIEYDTRLRLSDRLHHLVCPDCLTFFGAHMTPIRVTYYGCRTCGQSRHFFDCAQGVNAVLDSTWSKPHKFQVGLLRLNWLARRELFDFDRVEIVRATDEEVERFAVQVGNDTDDFRKSRYARLTCTIAPTCDLSENTRRVLDRIFGEVQDG